MTNRIEEQRGSAMIMALGAIAVLAVVAIAVVAIVVSERRTGFSEYAGTRAFYSADAASEAGVSWIRRQYSPPATVDSLNHVHAENSYTAMANNNRYKYDVTYLSKRYRPGWSLEFVDYEYRVDASGASAQQSQSAIEVRAARLYREGY